MYKQMINNPFVYDLWMLLSWSFLGVTIEQLGLAGSFLSVCISLGLRFWKQSSDKKRADQQHEKELELKDEEIESQRLENEKLRRELGSK